MSKDLQASVKLETKTAEARLKKLTKAINQVQAAVDRTTRQTSTLDRVISKTVTTTNRVVKAQNDVTKAVNRTNAAHRQTSSLIGGLTTKLKRLAGTYLGVLGLKAALTTSDTITKTENKLNALNGNDKGATQDAMDKMYAAAQRSRIGYADMMNNVSKSMTLAGDAFKGNINNAIRFQEIMGKTYALGGASAAEQASSMYQLIQSLGAGKLQGDELRSMTEGAPLAAKAIEKYAQKIYKTTDALKDMGSAGLITSDIVVAAMMSMGNEVDKKFEQTAMTFEQAWTNIKNVAVKSFEPVLQKMNELLNSNVGQSIIEGIGTAIRSVATSLLWVFGLLEKIYNFIVTAWPVISKILTILGIFLGVYLVKQIGVLTGALLAMAGKAILTLSTMVVEFIAMGNAVGYAAAMSIMFGISMNMWAWIALAVLAIVIIVLVIIADSFEDACGIIVGTILWAVSVIGNVFVGTINGLIQVFWSFFVAPIAGAIDWIVNAFNGAFDGIGGAFKNLLGQMLSALLGILKPFAAILDAVFGFNLTDAISNGQASMKSWGLKEGYEASNIAGTAPQLSRFDNTDAFDTGYGVGVKGGQWISDKISGIGSALTGASDPSSADIPMVNDYKDILNPTLNGIADDTGKIADTVELTEEDLAYLKDVAHMEWKKEFTTATIQVDMSNYNSIAGDSDLDGIVTKLTEKLYQELDYVANGVYE